jgi:hypothetical protein
VPSNRLLRKVNLAASGDTVKGFVEALYVAYSKVQWALANQRLTLAVTEVFDLYRDRQRRRCQPAAESRVTTGAAAGEEGEKMHAPG